MEKMTTALSLFSLLTGFLVLHFSKAQEHATNFYISKNPYSILVPINTEAEFTCTAYCVSACEIDWIIGDVTVNPYQKRMFESRGFQFSDPNKVGNEYTVRLKVSALLNLNNTVLWCNGVLDGGNTLEAKSTKATLLIVQESPVSPNPSIAIQSKNYSLVVEWSPPFLWPGYRIDHFNITVRNLSSGRVSHGFTKGIFSDTLVTFVHLIEPEERGICSRLEFIVSAVSLGGETLQPFTVRSGYPAILDDFNNSFLSVHVYFTKSGAPVVNLNITLPSVCMYQELDYTIVIEDKNNTNVTMLGPFKHLGSGLVRHDNITSDLKRDEEYSLWILINTLPHAITSHQQFFDTHFQFELVSNEQCKENVVPALLHYKIGVGFSLAISTAVPFVWLFLVHYLKTKFCVDNNSERSMPKSVLSRVVNSSPTEHRSSMTTDNESIYAEVKQDGNTHAL